MELLEKLYNEHGMPDNLQMGESDKLRDKAYFIEMSKKDFEKTLDEKQLAQFRKIMEIRDEIEERENFYCFKNGVSFVMHILSESGPLLE